MTEQDDVRTVEFIIDDAQEVVYDVRNTARLITHLADSPHEVSADEWHQIRDRLLEQCEEMTDAWNRSGAALMAERRAHDAELAALRKAKTAPGSAEDAGQVRVSWRLLMAAANAVKSFGGQAGYQLEPFVPDLEAPRPPLNVPGSRPPAAEEAQP